MIRAVGAVLTAADLPRDAPGCRADFDPDGRVRRYALDDASGRPLAFLELDPSGMTGRVCYEKSGEQYRDGAATAAGPFTDPTPRRQPFWTWVRAHIDGIAELARHRRAS